MFYSKILFSLQGADSNAGTARTAETSRTAAEGTGTSGDTATGHVATATETAEAVRSRRRPGGIHGEGSAAEDDAGGGGAEEENGAATAATGTR